MARKPGLMVSVAALMTSPGWFAGAYEDPIIVCAVMLLLYLGAASLLDLFFAKWKRR